MSDRSANTEQFRAFATKQADEQSSSSKIPLIIAGFVAVAALVAVVVVLLS